jgi:hypothetical protein
MRRRNFLKSVAQAAVVAPVAGSLVACAEPEKVQQQEVPHFEIFDWFDVRSMPEIKGFSSGVGAIDETTKGFLPGQLIAVHGPLDHINRFFLFDMAIYNACKKKKVDYIYTQSNFYEYFNQKLWTLKPQQRKEFHDDLVVEGFLRLPDVDIGNPNNLGWKEYVSLARKSPPEILILDGAELIEFFLNEKKIAQQLKNLAQELNIPVVVQAIPYKKGGIDQVKPDKTIRKDFESISDVTICFMPEFVCDYRSGKKSAEKYYSLKTFIWGRNTLTSNPSEYSSVITLQFEEPYLRFASRI